MTSRIYCWKLFHMVIGPYFTKQEQGDGEYNITQARIIQDANL